MILCQDVLPWARPLEYFDSDRKTASIAVRLPMGCVLSGRLPSSSCLYSTCFKAIATNKELDSELADQLRSWYYNESYGANKHVVSRSATDARMLETLEKKTYHDINRYHVGMLWTEADSSLPDILFSALLQLKSLEGCLDKDLELKQFYAKQFKATVSKWNNPESGTYLAIQ